MGEDFDKDSQAPFGTIPWMKDNNSGIELNDSIRKSAYSFTLVNNKLRVFPDPEEDSTIYFDYVKTSDRDNPLQTEYSGSANVVSDFSNVKYDNMSYFFYNKIPRRGRQLFLILFHLAKSKDTS